MLFFAFFVVLSLLNCTCVSADHNDGDDNLSCVMVAQSLGLQKPSLKGVIGPTTTIICIFVKSLTAGCQSFYKDMSIFSSKISAKLQ